MVHSSLDPSCLTLRKPEEPMRTTGIAVHGLAELPADSEHHVAAIAADGCSGPSSAAVTGGAWSRDTLLSKDGQVS